MVDSFGATVFPAEMMEILHATEERMVRMPMDTEPWRVARCRLGRGADRLRIAYLEAAGDREAADAYRRRIDAGPAAYCEGWIPRWDTTGSPVGPGAPKDA